MKNIWQQEQKLRSPERRTRWAKKQKAQRQPVTGCRVQESSEKARALGRLDAAPPPRTTFRFLAVTPSLHLSARRSCPRAACCAHNNDTTTHVRTALGLPAHVAGARARTKCRSELVWVAGLPPGWNYLCLDALKRDTRALSPDRCPATADASASLPGSPAVAAAQDEFGGRVGSSIGVALLLFWSTLRSKTFWLNASGAVAALGGVAGRR
mmetsp:Transcript_36407/g.115955  ORF Transcript_36407/g.115955 Transcript_36407/m.115955 type:complete len:211 (-) Transcript_36407:1858-2490(-)